MATFDAEGARKAGYSDNEIEDFLREQEAVRSPRPQAPPPAPSWGFGQKAASAAGKVAGFLGISNLGKGVAQAAFQKDPAAQALQESLDRRHELDRRILSMAHEANATGNRDKAKKLLALVGSSDKDLTVENAATEGKGYVSDRQVAGSALNLATLLGTAGSGAAATRSGRTAAGAAAGALGGAGSALESGSSLQETSKAAAFGALAGGGLAGGGELLAAGAKRLARGAAEEIYNQLVKTPKNQVVAGKESIGSGLLKRGVAGSYDSMEETVRNLAKENAVRLQRAVQENAGVPVDVTGVRSSLQKLQKQLRDTPGESTSGVDAVLEAISADRLPLAQAQELKRNLQAAVADSFLRQNVTGVTQAQKLAAQKLRTAIEEAVPAVAEPNRELEFASRAVKRLVEQGNLSPSKLRMYAELGFGIYGAKDSAESGKVSPILATIAAERLLTNPSTASRLALAASRASSRSAPQAASRLAAFSAGRNASEAP